MAVLRAAQLWATFVNFAKSPGTLPADSPVRPWEASNPEPRALWGTLFTVPAGKKAIIRCITNILDPTPPTTESPATYITIKGGPGAGRLVVHKFWWRTYDGNQYYLRSEDLWEGMVVVPAGWIVEGWNGSTTVLHTTGSGMLVDA